MTVTESIVGFAGVAAVLTIIPGLDTSLVLRSALVRGRRHAAAAAAGISAGALSWGVAAAVGAAALLSASEIAYRLLTVLGAVYMLCLGGSLIRRSTRRTPATDDAAPAPTGGLGRSFATGLVTNLLNPKIGAFYVAVIPQFLPDGASHIAMGLSLAGIHVAIGLIWFALIIVAAGTARRYLIQPRAARAIDRITGGILIAFGARLALHHR